MIRPHLGVGNQGSSEDVEEMCPCFGTAVCQSCPVALRMYVRTSNTAAPSANRSSVGFRICRRSSRRRRKKPSMAPSRICRSPSYAFETKLVSRTDRCAGTVGRNWTNRSTRTKSCFSMRARLTAARRLKSATGLSGSRKVKTPCARRCRGTTWVLNGLCSWPPSFRFLLRLGGVNLCPGRCAPQAWLLAREGDERVTFRTEEL
jgi:hypothetical protein